MTEEIAATPGWVETRLDEVFATIPDTPAIRQARAAYATCLAARKAPAAPSDMLGGEFAACRPPLHQALRTAGLDTPELAAFGQLLEAAEAEIAGGS